MSAVCASDGIMYDNECLMRVAACKHGVGLSVVTPEKCEDFSGFSGWPVFMEIYKVLFYNVFIVGRGFQQPRHFNR